MHWYKIPTHMCWTLVGKQNFKTLQNYEKIYYLDVTPSTGIFLFRLKQPVAAIQLPKEGETYYTFESLE